MVGAHGRDVRPVIAERDTKSVSAEETFDVDLSDPAEMAQEVAHSPPGSLPAWPLAGCSGGR